MDPTELGCFLFSDKGAGNFVQTSCLNLELSPALVDSLEACLLNFWLKLRAMHQYSSSMSGLVSQAGFFPSAHS